ncbi:MAG: hypothetical protein HQK96_20730 [Nitrospirae bacterium]|nr:hypothetical protein [Nitrospirota bacterium]
MININTVSAVNGVREIEISGSAVEAIFDKYDATPEVLEAKLDINGNLVVKCNSCPKSDTDDSGKFSVCGITRKQLSSIRSAGTDSVTGQPLFRVLDYAARKNFCTVVKELEQIVGNC